MKIAFLGKGGSGKSTLATHAVRYLNGAGHTVLAIDADHNMDLSFNLLSGEAEIFLGANPDLIKRHIGIGDDATFSEALSKGLDNGIRFGINPMDRFTAQVSKQVSNKLFLITAGPHTEAVRFGGDCSHSLSAPLKAYLPLLVLGEEETAVVDERAGTDPIATGILRGVEQAIVVADPTVQGVRVAGQISKELVLARVPHLFVANKVRSGDEAIYASLSSPLSARVPFSPDAGAIYEAMRTLFSDLSERAR
jgi:CO dehydrogenase maturation factor